jgi:endoglucanase
VIDTIRKLVEAWGPSGFEHQVRALIQAEVAPYVDEMRVDALGNLICRVGSGGRKIMVAAHMDEIGVMVTYVEKTTGYLRFAPIGGLLNQTLVGGRVRFEDGTIGVIGAPEIMTNRTIAPELDDCYIDVSTGDDASGGSIQPGMAGVFWRTLEQRGSRLIAKSMDDRIGCAIAIEALRRLNKQTENELYFVFTVQEEVGIRGARTAAYSIQPDIAIALDVTLTGDLIQNNRMDVRLGEGAAIKLHDPGLVVPPQIRDWMIARAEADGIPYQRELLIGGTTDAAGIHTVGAGVPSGCISIPCRFVHTTSETVDLRDVEAAVALLVGLCAHAADIASA